MSLLARTCTGKGGNMRHSQQHLVVKREPPRAASPLDLFLRLSVAGNAQQEMLRRNILALRRGPIRYCRNKIIACEGDPAEYVFIVVSGILRTCRTFRNGARSIIAFHLPEEMFGWTYDTVHALSVEAATDASVLFIKRDALIVSAARNAAMANFLLAGTASELRHMQDHSLLIGRDAKFRLTSFLTDLATRTGQTSHVDLPMRHQDIADYLGLKIETLSRTITELQRAGAIARQSRRTLILKDPASLAKTLS